MSKRYDLIGYCSYRDNEIGKISDNFVGVLNEQDQKIKDLEDKLAEKDQQIADLQHRLEVAEIALELACNIFAENDKAYKAKTKYRTPQQHIKILKEQAEKELKGE